MAGTVSADFPQSSASTAVFYSLLIPAVLLWFVYWRLSRRRLYELAENIPGPKGLPIIGNALDLTGTSHSEYRRRVSSINLINASLHCLILFVCLLACFVFNLIQLRA
jgi:hypothetical protein